MPTASSSTGTSAANSSSATGTSAQSALKRFKFLSVKLSQSVAGDSMNRGSTCASVHDQIEQDVNELRSTPQDEVFLAETSSAGATARGPVVCPSISGSGLLCLWLADSRTEKPLDKESGAASVLENEQRAVVTVTAY